jgi:ribose-phosphate pyrophosphokinase
MIDDMTTTAGTLCSAANMLADKGAKEIYACVSHGMITEKGIARLQDSPIKELVVTDTVPVTTGDFPIVVLSVAELLGEAILRIHENRSVTSLFRL